MQRFCRAIDTLQSHGRTTVTHAGKRCPNHHHGSVWINPGGCRWISAQQLPKRSPQQLLSAVIVMDGLRRDDIPARYIAVRAVPILKRYLADARRYRRHLFQHLRRTNTAAIRAQ
jgi:hypothetical protein